MTKRRNFSDNFKATVALEALRGDQRVQVIEGMAVGFDPATLDLMHEIDPIFTKYPFFGSHHIPAYLPQSGFSAGRRCVRHLMGNGVTGHRKRAKQEQEAPRNPHVSLPAKESANNAAQSGLVQRHHLYPSRKRLSVSGGDHGLGGAQSVGLAALKYAGCQLLY